MLDLHSTYDATGSTDTVVSENNANAVIPANDGATTIGISPFGNAILCAFGAQVTAAAQALTTIGLTSNNLVDPTNQLSQSFNSTPTITSVIQNYFLQLPYAKGPNVVRYANEAAGATITHKIDYLPSNSNAVGNVGKTTMGSFAPTNPAIYTVIFGGALTAGVYKTQAFNPTPTPPVGVYAVLGMKATALTTTCSIRLNHADFQGANPGFPLIDYNTGTLTGANQGGNSITSDSWQGWQFVQLSQILGVPCCPLFTIQGQGTGLNVQAIAPNADTPQVTLNLQKVA